MLENDILITTADLQQLRNGRDEIARLFNRLGFDASMRATLEPTQVGIIPSTIKAIKHMELLAEDDDLGVYLFELTSVTLAHRRAILQAFKDRGKQFLFVLIAPNPTCDRIDFVLSPMESAMFSLSETSLGKPAAKQTARPYAITIKPQKVGAKDQRLISRFTYTCADGLAQADKLFSVFKFAEWGQENFNNVGLFSDHYLKERLPEEEALWQDKAAIKAAFSKLRALGAPLSFLDHHLKCGNSLIGVTVEETHQAMTEKGNMFANRMAGVLLASRVMQEVASMPDSTPEQAAQSKEKYSQGESALWPYKRILDVYASQWFSNAEPLYGKNLDGQEVLIPF